MNSRAYYESQIMRIIKEIPDEAIPSFSNFIISIKSLFKKNLNIDFNKQELQKLSETGFCGCWEDERTAEEIIKDMESGRNYFSNREELWNISQIQILSLKCIYLQIKGLIK